MEVFQLAEPIDITAYRQPVCLDDGQFTAATKGWEDHGIVTGYGDYYSELCRDASSHASRFCLQIRAATMRAYRLDLYDTRSTTNTHRR